MLKYNVKRFCQTMNLKSFSSLNELIRFTMINYEKMSSKDYVNIFLKFRNLKANEEEYKIKYYDLMDYAFYNSSNFSDFEFAKSALELYIINNINNKTYLDFIVNQITKNHIKVLQTPKTFIYMVEKLGRLEYRNPEIWKLFEEIYFEIDSSFNLEEKLIIFKFFTFVAQGSDKFWKDFVGHLSKIEINDINQNHLCFIFRNIIMKMYDRNVQLTDVMTNKWINNFLKHLISQKHVKVNDILTIILSLFILDKDYKEHRELFNEVDSQTVENLLNNYIAFTNNELEKLSIEEITQLLKDALITRFTSFNNGKIKNYFVASEKTNSFKQNQVFLHYFSLLPELMSEKEINNLTTDYLFWENSVEEIYHFSFDEKILLFKLLFIYKVEYSRIWIILQTLLKNDISKNQDLKKVNFLLNLIKKQNLFITNEQMFRPFVLFLEDLQEKLIIKDSHMTISKN
jgi:hypothetical protein